MVYNMVHDLRKNNVEIQVFLWRTHTPNVYRRRKKYLASKFQIFQALYLK